MPGTNTIAYNENLLITTIKIFTGLAPEVKVIKLFYFKVKLKKEARVFVPVSFSILF